MSDKTNHAEQMEAYKIVNAYDDIVRTTVHEMMSGSGMCECEKCFLDACAIVFNEGFCRFVTTREGALLSKVPSMKHSSHVDLVVAVTKALRLVKDFPQH